MRDYTIRAAFHQSILKQAHLDVDTLVLDELGLKNGQIRADIAVLNGKLIGYEIKGERDTLLRLSNQINGYNEVFEKAYVVTSEKHIRKVTESIPQWWGIYCIEKDQVEHIQFNCVRQAEKNPERSIYGIAQLLWKVEATEVLINEYNCKVKQSHTRHHLYQMLTEVCNADQMAKIVLNYLKYRQGWRTDRTPLS